MTSYAWARTEKDLEEAKVSGEWCDVGPEQFIFTITAKDGEEEVLISMDEDVAKRLAKAILAEKDFEEEKP